MNSDEVCRVCLSASDELKSLHAKLYGKNKTIVETINFVVNVNIELGKGLPNKICRACESKLTMADVFKQRCLESEAILGQHVNIKKEKDYEELPTVLSTEIQEPAEYTKKTCLSSVADISSTNLLDNKTEDLIISSFSEKDPVEYFIKFESDEVHDHDETVVESHYQEIYTEELENETEQDSKTELKNSEKLISMKKDYGTPTPKRPTFGDTTQKIIPLETENPESSSSTAAITNLEKKSEEDVSLNIDKNERLAHQIKIDINKGKEPYFCNVCHKKFSRKSNLDRHARLHTGEKPYTCRTCDKKFSDRSCLVKHVKLHTGVKPYSCNVCYKKFSCKSSLDIHFRLHTGEKPYSCNECDKKYSDKNNLRKHVRLHTGEKTYFCNVCNKKFSIKNDLVRHVRLHTGEKPFSCNVCDKKFSLKGNLDLHVRIHTGEKPYSCNICDKKFSGKSNLDVHVRLHTGERPYCCNVCHKNFSHRSTLRNHERIHAGEKPYYLCNICEKKFYKKGNLEKHVRLHTS